MYLWKCIFKEAYYNKLSSSDGNIAHYKLLDYSFCVIHMI